MKKYYIINTPYTGMDNCLCKIVPGHDEEGLIFILGSDLILAGADDSISPTEEYGFILNRDIEIV